MPSDESSRVACLTPSCLRVILYNALQTAAVVRWCLFWIACGSIVTLIITPSKV